MHQQVARLAIQVNTDFLQGVKAHAFDFALFEQGHVGFGDADVLCQIIKVAPRTAGEFEIIDKRLALQLSVASVSTLGLEAPPRGRRWLVYSMPPQTQLELQRMQETIRQSRPKSQTLPRGKGGGSLSVGLEQDSLATSDPALAGSRWDTWLQTHQSDGFFEVWSGTLAQLKKIAAEKK